MKNRKPYIIAQEGWKKICCRVGIFIILMLLGFNTLALIPLFCILFLAYNYYDPEVLITANDKDILSIASGTVSSIQTKNDIIQIDTEVGFCNNSILRSPISGTIKNFSRINGVSLPTTNILSNTLNSRITFDIINDNSSKVKVEIIQNRCIWNIESFIKEGDVVNVGDRIGLSISAKVKLFLDKNTLLNIDLNSKVKNGETVIGFR
jgi:phosphatidylserine decarboxylase